MASNWRYPSRRRPSVDSRPATGRARRRRSTLVPLLAVLAFLGAVALLAPAAEAATVETASGRTLELNPRLEARRIASPIVIDADISDAGWAEAARVTTWYETNPGDNLEPTVENVAYLAYDDQYFYAAFEFGDPEPGQIRAPLADRDNVPGSTDYGGVILDSRNDGKTGQMFLVNPRGIQYDAISSDVAGEDSSPDFYWDAAARITESGWVLEMRVPFSSLRYDSEGGGPQTWGVLLYRNWPRDFRRQLFSAPLPRGGNCFICYSNRLEGLDGLPAGGGWVVAPYATAGQARTPAAGLGTPLATADVEIEPGVDVKWRPNPDLVIDGTVNPDFSQVEADVPQIAANERFALFFPETRPFFLEGIDLFQTPLQAVYTRTFTSPRWGARATGALESSLYTVLVGEDRGGGSSVLPGPEGSGFASQDFGSTVAIGRFRHDMGDGFVSLLGSAREIDGGAYNRVVGPDFRWRPTGDDTVTGQLLWSDSRTPDRPDLAAQWDGRSLSGHAAEVWWHHGETTRDWFLLVRDIDDEFRADNGFVPQVGYRLFHGETGRTWRPENKPISRLRVFLEASRSETRDGDVLYEGVSPGFGFDGRWDSFVRMELDAGSVRSGDQVFDRTRLYYTFLANPGKILSAVRLSGWVGEDVDFANSRLGDGASVSLRLNVRPTDHLEISANADRRWLDVAGGRLFTAEVARLRATYTFNARSYVRLIAQEVSTDRDPSLYFDPVTAESRAVSTSALFAYKLNWQTVLFLGFGDDQRLLDTTGEMVDAGQQLFLKVSYAFQG